MTRFEQRVYRYHCLCADWFLACLIFRVPWEGFRTFNAAILVIAFLLTILVTLRVRLFVEERADLERVFVSGIDEFDASAPPEKGGAIFFPLAKSRAIG